MGKELYLSVVSKIAIRVPMFARAMVDKALDRIGATPYTVTPSQMKRAIEEHIAPMLESFLSGTEQVRHLGSGVIHVDDGDRLIQVSPAARRMLGFSGSDPEPARVVARAQELGLLMPGRELEDHQGGVLVSDVRLPSGLTVNVAMTVLRQADGRFAGILSLLQDVTLTTHLEEEVDHVFQELAEQARTLKESEAKLQYYVAELEEATRMKSRLLANVSHELRTPLNAIIGFTDTVLQGVDGPLLDAQRESLGWVSNSAHHLLALIDDLLDLSRMDAGKLELTPEWVKVDELLDAITGTLSGMAREKGLDLRLEVVDGPPRAHVDVTRLRQIVLNLASNAVKFTSRGSVVLRLARDAESFRLDVVDTGSGIPEHLLPHIWNEFDQAPSRDRNRGVGLGLPISKRLVELMGGTLSVQSVVGEGSTFTLVLPLEQRSSAT